MATTFEHVPTARTFVLDRNPDLGNNFRRDLQQDVLNTDSGKARVFSRKIPKLFMDISFRGLKPREQSAFEEFYYLVLQEAGNKFNITFEAPVPVSAPLQAGMTIGGNLIQAGDLIQCKPGDPGFIIQAGQFLKEWDFVPIIGARLVQRSVRTVDPLKKGSDLVLSIEQELDPL